MTLAEVAPAAFVALFTLAVLAIALELVVRLLARLGRSSPALAAVRRVARVTAPMALVGAGLLLVWLSNREAEPPSTTAVQEPAAPVTISADGIGVAGVGATRADVRAALPAGHALGGDPAPYMVDLVGVPVTQGADTLYVLLYHAGEPDHEDAPVTLVATTSPRARTEEDVGPGTSLAEARVRYGVPTLSYNVMGESREYARFPEGPGDRVIFRAAGVDGGFAGDYESGGEYREATTYDPAARISMVMVRLNP